MTVKKEDKVIMELSEYLSKLNARISDIEKQSKSIVRETSRRDIILSRTASSLKARSVSLKKNISEITKLIEADKTIIKQMIHDFKNIAKVDRMDKLKDVIDSWGPEKFLTRNELLKNDF